MELKPGWLAEELKRAPQQLRAAHSPDWFIQNGMTVTLPIKGDDANELFRALAGRFHSWTGQDIRQFKLE